MKIVKNVSILLLLLVIGVGGYFGYRYMNRNSTDDNIQYIRDHINSRGELVDLQNDLGVKTVEDIRFFLDDETAKIVFGKVKLVFPAETFTSKETRDKIATIGFEVRQNKKTGRILLYWHGEEVERWVST